MQEAVLPAVQQRHKWRRLFPWLIPLIGLSLAAGWYLAAGPRASDTGFDKPFTVLALGADERPGSPGRSDSIMLVSFHPAEYRLRVLSIPRDTWARIPGHGWDKINHAYANGRETLSVKTVEELLAIPIDHYVVVSMEGFRNIVDILGGVDIEVDHDLKYHDPFDQPPLHIDIKAGRQHLDGTTALHFVRYRNDSMSDWGRMKRQQAIIRALIEQARRPQNLVRLPAVIARLYGAIRTDLPLGRVTRLALIMKSHPDLNLETASLSGQGRWIGGGYYLELDLFEARKMTYRFLHGEEPGPDYLAAARKAANQYRESVARALARAKPAPAESQPPAGAGPSSTDTGRPGPSFTLLLVDASASNVGPDQATRLTNAGFRIVQLVTGDRTEPQTVLIIHDSAPESGQSVKKLQALFPTANLVTAPGQGYPAQAEVILGKDLAPPPL